MSGNQAQSQLFKFLFENEVCEVKQQSESNFAIISHMILIFRICLRMSKRNQMIKFELNLS